MQGEFRGDFTRDTYNKSKHFLRVLMQQGRVQLDADFNEQISILLDRLQTLAKDVLGLHGGPDDNCGFEVIATVEQINNINNLNDKQKDELKKRLQKQGFLIGKGNYYVEGLLCENEDYTTYSQQPEFTSSLELENQNLQRTGSVYLAYLDVWERHITHVEYDNEINVSIRELALGGVDTATRSKLIWQVKLKELKDNNEVEKIKQQITTSNTDFLNLLGEELLKPGKGKMRARASNPSSKNVNDPRIIPFNSSYRGAENQLYRVEIFAVSHDNENEHISFAWSRDNSSVVFPIVESVATNSSTITLILEYLDRDSRYCLLEGDWVEIIDDDYVLQDSPRKLLKVDKIDTIENQVTLTGDGGYKVLSKEKHPLLRRWESIARDVKLSTWIPLEDGIEVQFEKEEGVYQIGDYWLIPVRTATRDVEWPKIRSGNQLVPEALTPHGIAHHYAPLAIISGAQGNVTVDDCRNKIGSKEKTILPPKEFNRVINASWHHDQVFKQEQGNTPPEGLLFKIKSQELRNLFTQLGLIVQFQKPVRVDSLHQSSVSIYAHTNNIEKGLVFHILPMLVEAVKVKKTESKSITWLIGNDNNDNEVQGSFNLITECEPLSNANDSFTEAVRLIAPKDWLDKEVFKQNGIYQFTVILRGDWIINEEPLFDTINVNYAGDLNKGTVPDGLSQQFHDKVILLSPNISLVTEKKDVTWRLTAQNKIYIIRLDKNKLTISETHALDGNNIWPGIPERSSGNGTEGGDWISAIYIK